MSVLRHSRIGLGAWKSALQSLRQKPRVRVFVLLPLIVYSVLLALLLYLMLSQLPSIFFEWISGFVTASWAQGVLKVLSFLAALVLWALVVVPVYALSNLIMSPVHSLAAEHILKWGGAQVYTPEGAGAWLRFFMRSLGIGLLKSVLLIFASIPLFLGGFLPGVGVVFVFLSFVILSFDCTDYSLEVLDLSLAQRFGYLRKHRWAYVGFSSVFFLASFVPLAMFIVLPVGIVAGAHLVLALETKKQEE